MAERLQMQRAVVDGHQLEPIEEGTLVTPYQPYQPYPVVRPSE